VRWLPSSRQQRIRQLLTLEEMVNHKTSHFPRHLRSLAPDVPDDFLHSIWSDRLPPNVRAILSGQPESNLDAAACCVDRIIEAASQPELMSVAPLPDSAALLQWIENLSRQVAALSTEQQNIYDPNEIN
jgi:hypothetical protein